MDEKAQRILDYGRKYIAATKESELPLDYSEKSIEYLWELIASLKSPELPEDFKNVAVIGIAIYLWEMLKKKNETVELNLVFSKEGTLEEIQAVNDKATFNLLSWVLKCMDDPETDNVASKFQVAKKIFAS